MYHELKTLLENRRTPRYVDRDDIPEDDINKILDAAKLAPSFDKVYPYEVHVLTNSAAGIVKKEALVDYYVCCGPDGITDTPGDSWNEREICQPILSGLVLVYIATPKLSATSRAGPNEKAFIAHRDAMLSATYAMISAKSLGYASGMFGSVAHGESLGLFTNNASAKIVTSVTIATRELPFSTADNRQYISYKNQQPFVYTKKHQGITRHPKITVV